MTEYGLCINCAEVWKLKCRGLCESCYGWHQRRQLQDLFPSKQWKNADLVAELAFFQGQGLTLRDAARRVGVSLSAARQARTRAGRGTRSTTPADALERQP